MNPGGILLLVIVGWIVLGFGLRFIGGSEAITIRNLTPAVQIVRILDGTSGRTVGTLSIAADSMVRLGDLRVDVWYRDLSIQELADGRTAGMIAELLSPEGCALLGVQSLDSLDSPVDIEYGEFVLSNASDPPGRPAVHVADPCAGQPARPRGLIANRTLQTIVLGSRLVVAPCSKQIVVAGDLASPPDPVLPLDAVRVHVPSIDIQGQRWPIEPRSVVITSAELFDDGGGFEGYDPESCAGRVPTRFVIPD